MKKLSVLLVAALVAVSAFAGKPINHPLSVKKGIKAVNTEKVKFNSNELKAKANSKINKFAAPEGDVINYDRSGGAVIYVASWFGSYIEATEQGGTDRVGIIYGEDNKVYLKNIIFGAADNYGDFWVEGTIEDNLIYVPLGQKVYSYESYGVDVVLGWGTTYIADDGYFNIDIDERATDAVYMINQDGTISLLDTQGVDVIDASSDESYLATGLALVYAGNEDYAGGWDGFIEWNTVLTEHIAVPVPNIIYDQPEGDLYTYYRNSACVYNNYGEAYVDKTNGKVNVVFGESNYDGTRKVYIQDPLWWRPLGTWVEGTYNWMTGEISIPTGQCIGWSEADEYGILLGWGSSKFDYAEYDDWYEEYINYVTSELDENVTEIKFMIDGDYLYLLDTKGNIEAEYPDNYNATGMMGYWSDDLSMDCVEFCNRDEYGYAEPWGYIVNLVPAVPANPTADDWYDCGDETGFSKFYFTLPTEDVDGNIIDPEYLSYSIFIDNGNGPELFTFPAEDYTFDLYDDITEVPYELYSSAVDFRDYFVYMYRTNAEGYEPLFTENIGIQVYYTINGVKNASEIVWLYEHHVGVDEVLAGKTVANVRYFNVAGQEMAQPEGMTIKVTTYTDGTTNAVKVVK
jgi:hypothetical protein